MTSTTHFIRRIAALVKRPWQEMAIASTAPTNGWYIVGEGVELWIESANEPDRLLVTGGRSAHIAELIRKWVREGDCAVDVGAGSGYVSIQLAHCVGSTGMVHAFDPDARTHDGFRKNIERNRVSNVTLHATALGAEHTVMRFYRSTHRGWSTFFPAPAMRESIDETAELEVRTIDGLKREGKLDLDPARLSFINVDCTGSEPFAIEGMDALLHESDPLINICVNEEHLRTAGSSLELLQHDLASKGYVFFRPVKPKVMGPSLLLRRQMSIDGDRPHDVIAVRLERVAALTECGVVIRP